MILIADSGGSKTSWRLINENGDISQFETEGMNPMQKDKSVLDSILRYQLLPVFGHEPEDVGAIFFYGTGCLKGEPSTKMKTALGKVFSRAEIEVEDDMLAVARGVCGSTPGIACILGTGSNSCLYDGAVITSKVPALGYILGDEGSGAWMGKEILAAYIRQDLPPALQQRFRKRYGVERSDILAEVYGKGHAAAYLAGFSKFLFDHRSDPFVYQLIHYGFTLFFEKNVMKYPDYENIPVHFSGSVAFYYSTILRDAAARKQITVRNIVEGPIAGLALYHQNNN